ncbi:uncharacterized protein LOC131208163 [Anopheles bellator]|uniref:uncharacterized protein LOC131208163 n=1 Tax=Anopheles bellator TaxID=139047 RepID=UPI002649BD35|nr:uncharacterized protein LOC131208163 [Anopheles bellator]
MSLIATCTLCQSNLSCDRSNTAILIQHLQSMHCPEPTIVELAEKSTQTTPSDSKPIAEWRPAESPVKCPQCGGRYFPTVRLVTSRVSRNAIGAYCLLCCWPLCFLSCIFNRPTKQHLHCSNCNAFLGLYEDCKKSRRITTAQLSNLRRNQRN